MKKEWMEPVVEVQEFTVNEYVAACGDSGKVYKFECNVQDDFIKGYMDDVNTWENENIPVIIWTDGGTDVHCTKNLDINSWETAKS